MSKGLQFSFLAPSKPKREAIGEHACEVCGGRASFGYGVSYLRNVEGRWRCHSHRISETQAKGEAA